MLTIIPTALTLLTETTVSLDQSSGSCRADVTTDDELLDMNRRWLHDQPSKFFADCINELIKRWDKCLDKCSL